MEESRTKNITCQVIGEAYFPKVIEFLRESFYIEEPIFKMLEMAEKGQPNQCLDEHATKALEQGLSIMALNTDEDKVVGVTINTDVGSGKFEKNPITNEKIGKIEKLREALYEGIDLSGHYKASRWMYVSYVSVDSKYRGMGVAWKLMKATKEMAERKGFTGLTAEASAMQTHIIFERSGFDTLSEIPYENFPSKEDAWFQPEPPHLSIRLVAAHVSQVVI